MIIETIITTINDDNSLNVAPMGPRVESDFRRFELKPFTTSQTYQNLCRSKCGVLHITDDALLIAKAAIGQLECDEVETEPAAQIDGRVIASSIIWHEFVVDYVEDSSQRAVFKCRSVKSGKGRSWQGFNRGKHAILEAAILATRVSFLPTEEITDQFERLETIVKKTGGHREQEAFNLLYRYVYQ